MNTNIIGRSTVTSAMMAALMLAAVASVGWARAGAENGNPGSGANEAAEGKIVELKDARLKIEMNATDGDAGIHVYLDADPWKSMSIFDPFGRLVFRSTTYGRFAKQGGTELFLESAEPNFSQLTLAEFLKRFPEGEYQFRGKGLEGETYVGTAKFTHNLPAGPELVSPLEGGGLVDPNHAVVTWKPVGPANGSPIVGYEVLVVLSPSGTPALPKIVLDITMPPTATSVAIPAGFLRPDTQYIWEVLAIEASGNQTLSSASFRTAP